MRKMTSKERILRAVEHQEPDRVPICPRSVDYTWLTPLVGHPAGWKDLLDFSQQVGFDPWFPVEANVRPSDEVRVTKTETDLGAYVLCTTCYDTPKGRLSKKVKEYKQKTPGETFFYAAEEVRTEEYLVKDFDDLQRLPYLFSEVDVTAFQERVGAVGDRGLVKGAIDSAINLAVRTYGLQNLLEASSLAPEFFQALMEVCQRWGLAQEKALLEAGAEIIYSDYTYGTCDLWSPQFFREHIAPYTKEQVDLAHERGAKFHLMATGRFMGNLETIRDIGVDILSPFAPPPNGDADLKKAKALIGDKVCIWGGISAPLLQKAKPPEVEEMVQKAVEEAAEGGGFVLSTADSLNPNTPLENIRAFVEAGKRYGRYR